MANSPNQKLKQLYLMKILLEQTDEEHHMSVKDIIEQLRLHNIDAERKSLYADIERLQEFGINVETKKTNTVGYFVANRQFELAEGGSHADGYYANDRELALRNDIRPLGGIRR